jgi:hypothetical protein
MHSGHHYWPVNQPLWDRLTRLRVADGQIPISMVLTGAEVHDSQVAIPLATITSQRVTSLYDLMDSAYDAPRSWNTAGSWDTSRSSIRPTSQCSLYPRQYC